MKKLLTAAAIAVTAVTLAAPAQADPVENYALTVAPAVCATLDEFPTFDGVKGVGYGIVADTGWSFYDAGQVIRESVVAVCPYHNGLLDRFVATYDEGKGYVA